MFIREARNRRLKQTMLHTQLCMVLRRGWSRWVMCYFKRRWKQVDMVFIMDMLLFLTTWHCQIASVEARGFLIYKGGLDEEGRGTWCWCLACKRTITLYLGGFWGYIRSMYRDGVCKTLSKSRLLAFWARPASFICLPRIKGDFGESFVWGRALTWRDRYLFSRWYTNTKSYIPMSAVLLPFFLGLLETPYSYHCIIFSDWNYYLKDLKFRRFSFL